MRPAGKWRKLGGDSVMSGNEFLEDEEARNVIEELYQSGHGLADYVIEQILGSQLCREEREDLIQEGFLRLTVHVDKLKKETLSGRLRYMYSTMRNVAIDEGRRRSKERLVSRAEWLDRVEPPSTSLTPEQMCMMQQDIADKNRRLRLAMERLTEQERFLLVGKYLNGLSDREIGAKLGIKPRNVRIYVSRARVKAAMYYGEVLNEEQQAEQARNESSAGEGNDGIHPIAPSGNAG